MLFRPSDYPDRTGTDNAAEGTSAHRRKPPPVALAVGVIALGAAFISAPHLGDAITLARGSLNAPCAEADPSACTTKEVPGH